MPAAMDVAAGACWVLDTVTAGVLESRLAPGFGAGATGFGAAAVEVAVGPSCRRCPGRSVFGFTPGFAASRWFTLRPCFLPMP